MSHEKDSTAPAVTTPVASEPQSNKQTRLIVQDNSEVGYLMDSARFDQAQRVATTLAHAALTPKHLRGGSANETIANCFRVVNQALRWGMDPFQVADETYVVGGRLGYQGKLVASVVNTRSNLGARLRCEYEGEGDGRKITVIGRFANEDFDRTIDLTVGQAKTANEMWRKDPDQKLYYSAVVKWARRHCPEVILGVLTEDDVDHINKAVETPALPAQRHRMLTPAEMKMATEEIESGNATIDEIIEQIPNLSPAQVEELRAVKVRDEEPTQEPIRLDTSAE